MKEAVSLLHLLLDKYEHSALYKGTPRHNRRIWLPFNRRTLPRYFDDTTAVYKDDINEAARLLAERELVEIVWERFEEGNLIKKIALRPDRIADAYLFLGRRPREAKEDRVVRLAREYAGGAAPWVRDFLHLVAERAEKGESVARYLDLDDPERAVALFKALREAGRLEEEIPRRIFSQRVLGSTKAFDAVAGTVARVAAEFDPRFRETAAGAGRSEVLAELGIVDNPQHIFISGGLQFSVAGRVIDVAHFHPDLGISTEMIRNMTITALPADYVITIENLAAFYSFVKSGPRKSGPGGNVLAVYLGGYHNTLRRRFLFKIREFADQNGRQIAFFHWGDIDFGGFCVFAHLRDNCLPRLQPLFMDEATLTRYRKYCLPFNDRYAKKLRRLREDERYRVFHPVIAYMLQHRVRLEQECVGSDVKTRFRPNRAIFPRHPEAPGGGCRLQEE
ncbi:MAG: hypothetical protein IBX71_05860 [Candidatus Desulforudis sp.]|nr:hypothetical protein [Desulforudis sp.]